MTEKLLTVAINYGNPALAYPNGQGLPAGVSVDLACRIAEIMSLTCQFVCFDAAKDASDAVGMGECDIGFFAADPARADKVAFTRPYMATQGSFLVREGSFYLCNEDIDHKGVLIGVGQGSAYDLFLTRRMRHATLVRESTSPEVVNTFLRLDLDVAAGVRTQLEADAARVEGLRLIEPAFIQIQQAIGVSPALSKTLLEPLNGFISRSTQDGFITEALQRHGVKGAVVLNVPLKKQKTSKREETPCQFFLHKETNL